MGLGLPTPGIFTINCPGNIPVTGTSVQFGAGSPNVTITGNPNNHTILFSVDGGGGGDDIIFSGNSGSATPDSFGNFFIQGISPIETTASSHSIFISLATNIPVPLGGTGTTSLGKNAVLYTDPTGTQILSQQLTDGQLFIGATNSAPVAANLTAGNNVEIVNSHGSITISAIFGSGMTITGNSGSAGINSTTGNFYLLGVDPILTVASQNTAFISLDGIVTVTHGGTGQSVLTNNAILYGNGTNAVGFVGPLANGELIIGATNTHPLVGTISGSSSIIVTKGAGSIVLAVDPSGINANSLAGFPITVPHGGTGVSSFPTNAVLYTDPTGTQFASQQLANGQVLLGVTGSAPVAATLTVTTPTWITVTSSTYSMSANQYYMTNNNTSTVTLTLPTTSDQFSTISVAGYGTKGWTVAQNASQSINIVSTSTTQGTSGSLSSTNRFDAIKILCTTANTDWTVIESMGTLTLL